MTKDDKIKEVMELVGIYGTKVENTVLSDGDSHDEHAETRAFKAIESKLRELIP